MNFGAVDEWPSVEANEMDLGKEDDADISDKDKPSAIESPSLNGTSPDDRWCCTRMGGVFTR